MVRKGIYIFYNLRFRRAQFPSVSPGPWARGRVVRDVGGARGRRGGLRGGVLAAPAAPHRRPRRHHPHAGPSLQRGEMVLKKALSPIPNEDREVRTMGE